MEKGRFLRVFRYVALLFLFFVLQGYPLSAHGADVQELLRQINNDIRQTERDMHGGRGEKAAASIEQLKEKILRAKELDPDNPQVKTSESRFQRLVRDLERRTGKDLGGGTLTAVAASTEPELPPKPESKPLPPSVKTPPRPEAETAAPSPAKPEPPSVAARETTTTEAQLPHAARRPVQNVENDLGRVDSAIERMSDPRLNPDQLVRDMKSHLESARRNLVIAREEAAKRGVKSHSQFEGLEAGIAEAETKIAKAREMHEASLEESAERAAEVTADVRALKAEYDRVQPLFSKASGGAIYYNDLEPVRVLIEAIEDFEKNDLDKIQQHMLSFGEKYGTTRDEIDRKAGSMGYEVTYYRASFAYTELEEGIENITKTRAAMADDLIRRAGEMKKLTTEGLHDFARLGQHKQIMEWGEVAARFDSENPRVKEFNSGIEAWVQADAKALTDKIDKAFFPGQATDAPGDAAKLVEAAVKFLQEENDKLAVERGSEVSKVLAVSITGPWRVFSTNLLGEPIQYNLPVAVAVQTESEKGQNLARVYYSTLLTREMRGVEMAPPFTGVTVGDSHYIRPSAI